jgi:uncharacterized membrane protein
MEDKKYTYLLIRSAKFCIPFILGFGVFAILGFILVEIGREASWMTLWPLIIAYFFPPFGKETIIPLGVGILEKGITVPIFNLNISAGQVNPLIMAFSIAFVDVVVALFLVWNYDLAKKIPFVGKFITRLENKGKNIETKYSWIKPLRFIGIVVFVMIPFQGSGGLVGSIVGRLIGMKPWNTFLAISIGAVTGCLLIAIFAQVFLIFIEINTTLTIVLILIIFLIILIFFIIKKRQNRNKKKK